MSSTGKYVRFYNQKTNTYELYPIFNNIADVQVGSGKYMILTNKNNTNEKYYVRLLSPDDNNASIDVRNSGNKNFNNVPASYSQYYTKNIECGTLKVKKDNKDYYLSTSPISIKGLDCDCNETNCWDVWVNNNVCITIDNGHYSWTDYQCECKVPQCTAYGSATSSWDGHKIYIQCDILYYAFDCNCAHRFEGYCYLRTNNNECTY